MAVYAVIPALLLLVVAEGALRLIGFRHEAAPMVLRFGYPDPREITGIFKTDPRLFWRLRPDSVFDAEASVAINASGYRGPVAAAIRPENLFRVAVMGDSVAFGFGVAWPELLQTHLERRLAGRPVEVLNFGVPGYTSVQGLRQFRDDVARLRPDVVVIAYGWNDHWLAKGGLPDAARRLPPAPVAALGERLARLRVVQAVHRLLSIGETAPVRESEVRRVPPETFTEQLEELAEEARGAGSVPVFVGLPSGFEDGEVPSYLVESGFTPSAEDAILDHDLYLDLTRRVAENANAPFVDLRPAMAAVGGGPDTALFSRDRIHPTAEGHARIAAALEEPVARAVGTAEIP
jgi:lysophospholipase L1-like esterase